MVDASKTKLIIKNTSSYPNRISNRFKLGTILELLYSNCFYMEIEPLLVMWPLQRNWAKTCAQVICMLATFISPSLLKVLITTLIDRSATTMAPVQTSSQFFHLFKIKGAIPNAVFTFNVYEKKLVNSGICFYGTTEELDKYMQLVN